MDDYDNFLRGTRTESSASSSHVQQQQTSEINLNSGSSSAFQPFQYPFTQFHLLSNEDVDKSTRCSDMLTEIDGTGSGLKSENVALWKELKKLKRELIMLHFGITRQAYGQFQGVPIVINNNTEAFARSQTYNMTQKDEENKISGWISAFFSRPANRIIFILSLGITGYMLQEKIKKSYLLSIVQEKINRNPLLKTVYAVEEFLGLRTPPKLNLF